MACQNGAEGIDQILRRDTIRCTVLERGETTTTDVEQDSDPKAKKSSFQHGIVIDDACDKSWLTDIVQTTRKNLPLNHKRPTVDRRFYCDTTRDVISRPLEKIVHHALELTGSHDDGSSVFDVYCNKYLRFLEYKTVGGELLPHRDGTKICEDTGIKSTHTLLLFLSDCEIGGETLILDDSPISAPNGEKVNNNWSKEKNLVLDVYETVDDTVDKNTDYSNLNEEKIFNRRRIRYTIDDNREILQRGAKTKVFRLSDASIRSIGSSDEGDKEDDREEARLPPPRHVSVGIQPSEGRILIFPHYWPHAGAMCKSVPKIALRAELTIAKAN